MRQHGVEVVLDLRGGDADHAKARGFKCALPCGVRGHLNFVDRPIDLDHDAEFCAVEVDHEPADDVLPAPLRAYEAAAPQRGPKERFGRCR